MKQRTSDSGTRIVTGHSSKTTGRCRRDDQPPVARGARGGRRGRNSPLAAFTLMELMIAVGALAVLAVAIAAVFEVTGRTVTGGRRVSAINAYANLIEQQMRQDFAAMSREGIMVMRHQYVDSTGSGGINLPAPGLPPAPSDDVVRLHHDDLSPRARRADEIVFFIKGQFTSAREPLHPQLIPSGDAARVYYGHGQKGTLALNDLYWRPELGDTNITANARLGRNVDGNPNRFASDWTLLRHTTVLAPRGDHVAERAPRSSRPRLDNTTLFPNANNNDPYLRDSEIQIAAQPAASSIFRTLSRAFPTNDQFSNNLNPCSTALRRGGGGANIRPQFTSGLVDIATTSLHEMRTTIMTSLRWPVLGSGNVDENFYTQFSSGYTYQFPATAGQFWDVIDRMHDWMENTFPSENSPRTEPNANNHRRIRYESVPPDVIGTLSGNTLESAFRRADQAMLASWGFLPHCTEFIVEWSLGHTFPSDPAAPTYIPERAGQLIWYGLERTADGDVPSAANLPLAWPIGIGSPPAPSPAMRVPWRDRGAATSVLIHGRVPDAFTAEGPLMSYFGYFDPTHTPTANNPTRDWPWPRYVRITLSLADPRDPSQEYTFQFIFDVPQE